MRRTWLFALVALLQLVASAYAARELHQALCQCTRELNPVCAGGKDFNNPCLAECEGFTSEEYTEGECTPAAAGGAGDKPCICTAIYAPVCIEATQKTFASLCVADCAGYSSEMFTIIDGECPPAAGGGDGGDKPACPCPLDLTPVCVASTSTTYGNKCAAECAGYSGDEITDGQCVIPGADDGDSAAPTGGGDECMCIELWQPVCAAGGKQYSNKCYAECAGVAAGDLVQGECAGEGGSGSNDTDTQPEPELTSKDFGRLLSAILESQQTLRDLERKLRSDIYVQQEILQGLLGDVRDMLDGAEAADNSTNATAPGNGGMDDAEAACRLACPNVTAPVCTVAEPQLEVGEYGRVVTVSTAANACEAACRATANPSSAVMAVMAGECDATADAACALALTPGDAVCVPGAGDATAVEYASLCYANASGAVNASGPAPIPGQCTGDHAVALVSSAKCLGGGVQCFADPCQVATCAFPGAVCLSLYCPIFFRSTFLHGVCQAVFVDPATGDLVEKCMKSGSA
ncbi:hypothetical protein FOA52_007903 [Chlamydomonas sp. UWO 241]|nr:hypothetical protein FOA52_007903 [Chlamydomonas sp. UWO 241]